MKKLSIIIPYYNCKEYTLELLNCLDPQITDDVQVILVDDGSKIPFECDFDWLTIIRQNNGGASSARNTGIENAVGKYIAFIDSDDLVAKNYISSIIEKIDNEKFDYCYLSWKTLPTGWQCDVKLNSINDEFPSFNLCCWNRIYKKSVIGDIRFNTKKLIAEDAEFIRDVEDNCKKKSFISDYMYYYRSDTPNSLTKRFANGELNTKRVVYYYNHISKNMKHLLDEVKETNKDAEVIIMTNNNELSELSKYAMVTAPIPMKGTELRGEPTNLFTKIDLPINTQVVIYTNKTFKIGGIETFIYNFCMNMKQYYDIIVLYDDMDYMQINRLKPFVRVLKNQSNLRINCDTVVINRITDNVPNNITYNKKIQMIHCCKILDEYHVNTNNDIIVPVSDAVYKSFKNEIGNHQYQIINNMTYFTKPNKVLTLVSATRLSFEKGKSRIIKFAEILHKNKIPFMWFIFTDDSFGTKIDDVYIMKPTLNVRDYIAKADYVVQLSDSEAFCYTIVESLELGIPVITTPIDVLEQIGFKDGENGFIVPFDMSNIDINKIYESDLKFEYQYNNSFSIDNWKSILGNSIPKNDYVYIANNKVKVQILFDYYDKELKRNVKRGEILFVTNERADVLLDKKACRILEDV